MKIRSMQALITRVVGALCLAVAALSGSAPALAAEGEVPVDTWPPALSQNPASLQNGARLFANYCIGCHSAALMRWNRLKEIGLTDAQIQQYLVPGNQKIGDIIRTGASPADQKRWFGKAPPDLSVITRARTSSGHAGTDYIYTLLRGYYRDAASPTGWNNVAYPNIAMPHVFWYEQGPREARIETTETRKDPKTGAVEHLRVVTTYEPSGVSSSTETPAESHGAASTSYTFKPVNIYQARRFDSDAADLVAFLAFMTDPTADTRVQIGVWVLFFLGLFTVITWRLNAVYWKKVR
ncbi:MAG: cytochrome c1 [Burkholderiaceae bacterium]